MFKRIRKNIIPFALWYALYMAAVISLVLPMGAIEEGIPFRNHIFLLIWAIVAMASAGQISWQKKRDKGEIVSDAIVAGVVVYSGPIAILDSAGRLLP